MKAGLRYHSSGLWKAACSLRSIGLVHPYDLTPNRVRIAIGASHSLQVGLDWELPAGNPLTLELWFSLE